MKNMCVGATAPKAINKANGITINKDSIIEDDGKYYIGYLQATLRVYGDMDDDGNRELYFDGVEAATQAGFKTPRDALLNYCPNAIQLKDLQQLSSLATFRKDKKFITVGDLHRLFTNSPVTDIRESANDIFFGVGAIAEQLAKNGVYIDNNASDEQIYYAVENKIIDYCKNGTKPGRQMQSLFATKRPSELVDSASYIANGLNGHKNKEWALELLHNNFDEFREEYRVRSKKEFKLGEFMELSSVGETIENTWRVFLSRSRGQQVSNAIKKGTGKNA